MKDVDMSSEDKSGWVDLGHDAGAGDGVDKGAAAAAVAPGQGGRIGFSATLENISGFPLFAKTIEEAKQESKGDEYLLTLESSVNVADFPWLENIKDEEVEFLVILDKSSSMNGQPWNQVQDAMVKMLELTRSNKKITLKIMTYNQAAQWIQLPEDPTAASMKIRTIHSGGSTSFKSVFEMVGSYLETGSTEKSGIVRGIKNLMKSATGSSKYEQKRKVFAFFLTDGQDTCSKTGELMRSKDNLQKRMAEYGEEVVVHVMGFSEDHNAEFLEELTMMGTADGSYSYIQPNEGPAALEERLIGLLEATTGLIGKSVFLELKMANNARFLGEWFGEGVDILALQAFMHIDDEGDKRAKLKTTKFVRIPSDEKLQLQIKLMKDLQENTKEIPCSLDSFDIKTEDSAMLKLRKFRTCLNLLTSRLSSCLDDGSSEKVMAEINDWLSVVKDQALIVLEQVKTGEDEETDKMAESVKSGLLICQESLTRDDPNESGTSKDMRARTTITTYHLSSGQMYNAKKAKNKTSRPEGSERSTNMLMQGLMD